MLASHCYSICNLRQYCNVPATPQYRQHVWVNCWQGLPVYLPWSFVSGHVLFKKKTKALTSGTKSRSFEKWLLLFEKAVQFSVWQKVTRWAKGKNRWTTEGRQHPVTSRLSKQSMTILNWPTSVDVNIWVLPDHTVSGCLAWYSISKADQPIKFFQETYLKNILKILLVGKIIEDTIQNTNTNKKSNCKNKWKFI